MAADATTIDTSLIDTSLIDLSQNDLARLLADDSSNLAVAVRRILDEADSTDRSDGISAFGSSF